MPLIDLTVQHGQTLEEARGRLALAVSEVSTRFGSMVRRAEWAADRSRVKLDGVGFWLEMTVDAQVPHATGDIPILGRLLGSVTISRIGVGLKPLHGLRVCGQFEITASTSISARSST